MWSKCVFFFKQKTAYEIKECDWSSDVCSSDLILVLDEATSSLDSYSESLIQDALKNLFKDKTVIRDRKSVV